MGKHATTPKQAWDAIMSLFKIQNDVKVMILNSQLYSLKLTTSMVDHIQQVTRIGNQLRYIAETVTHKDMIIVVLRSFTQIVQKLCYKFQDYK